MSGYGNNIEKLGFDKSTWSIVEIVNLDDGQEIYKGKAQVSNPSTSDPVWLIRKITVQTGDSSETIITEQTSGWNNVWDDRTNLIYELL